MQKNVVKSITRRSGRLTPAVARTFCPAGLFIIIAAFVEKRFYSGTLKGLLYFNIHII